MGVGAPDRRHVSHAGMKGAEGEGRGEKKEAGGRFVGGAEGAQ